MNKLCLWIFWRSISVLTPLSATIAFGYGFIYQEIYFNVAQRFAGKWIFLTQWDLTLQLLTFIIVLLSVTAFRLYTFHADNREQSANFTQNQMRGSPFPGKRPRTQTEVYFRLTCDYIYHTLAFPIGIFVTCLFWILVAIDINLLTNGDSSASFQIPPWLNHIEHTLPGLFSVLELFSNYHRRPAKIGSIVGLLLFAGTYIIWAISIGMARGVWAYPILAKNWGFKIGFIIGCSLFMLLLHFIGGFLHKLFWTQSRKQFFFTGTLHKNTEIDLINNPASSYNAI